MVEGDAYKIGSELENIETRLDDTKHSHDEAALEQRIFTHVLDRMNKDLIALKIKTNELMGSLKSKNLILETEVEKQR
jgi:hypothetical protein